MKGGGVVWRHGGVDGKPVNVDVSVSAMKMDRWKTSTAASESVPDRVCPIPGKRLGWGLRL